MPAWKVGMQPWVIVTAISLVFTVPVLASAYYSLILLISSFRYPRSLEKEFGKLTDWPPVSVLVATYNEKFVISRTLEELAHLKYPKEKLQVIVADDSTDETRFVVDKSAEELNRSGIATIVSRRTSRDGFKSGALNATASMLTGEYVLLLDADSIVTPEVLDKGVSILNSYSHAAFVSYRVGHYNRDQNLVTRLFALTLDLGDTLTKMGSYAINGPFSFQGGYTLLSKAMLKKVGFWSQDTIVEDADLSVKIYTSGGRGVYLSSVKISGEDPPTLEIWKKQAARVAQGWAKCVAKSWSVILRTSRLSLWRRFALLLTLLGPVSGLSWIVVTFLSAFSLALGFGSASESIFSNPAYVILVSLPICSFFVAAAYALHVQGIMTPRNLLLLPVLSYTGYSMLTATSIGFVSGVMGKAGFFFRTPKTGLSRDIKKTDYFREIALDKLSIIEVLSSVIALVLAVFAVAKGVVFLALSLIGFAVLTLRSVNLSRILPIGLSERGTGSLEKPREGNPTPHRESGTRSPPLRSAA